MISGDVNSEMGLLKERMGAIRIRTFKLLCWVGCVMIQNVHLQTLLLRKFLATFLTLIRINSKMLIDVIVHSTLVLFCLTAVWADIETRLGLLVLLGGHSSWVASKGLGRNFNFSAEA
jgi:hypothetical protein